MRGYSTWSEEAPLVLVLMDEIRWTSCMLKGNTPVVARRARTGSWTVLKPNLELDLEDLEELEDEEDGGFGTISMKRWLWE